MARVEILTGKILDLKLTDEELKEEQIHYPYNYVVREEKTITYKIEPNYIETENGEELKDIEIDDLPENINEILLNHINNTSEEDKDEFNNKILRISNLYSKETKQGPIFLHTNVILKNIKSAWGEIEYNEDKQLNFDYRFWPESGDTLLVIEDRYDTIYVDYNKGLEYIDPKINLDNLMECLTNKIKKYYI